MRQDKDRSSKWLIARYADSILHLVGITGFTRWKHLPGEVPDAPQSQRNREIAQQIDPEE